MDDFINDIRFDIGRLFPGVLRHYVVQQDKLSDFDAYGFGEMDLAIRCGIKMIHLYVTDTGEIYYIDADTFMKFAEVRSIENKPMYYCPLSHWSSRKE